MSVATALVAGGEALPQLAETAVRQALSVEADMRQTLERLATVTPEPDAALRNPKEAHVQSIT